MAEELNNGKPEIKKKKVSFLQKLTRFFRDYKSEFKKIVWPSFSETTKKFVVVSVVVVIVSLVVAGLDFSFSRGIALLSSVI